MSNVARPRPAEQRVGRKPARPAHGTCRLTLAINGTDYNVRPTPADSFAAIRAYRLRKADGTTYDVAETVHGHTCDCPDFIFHRDGLDPDGCKHIKALVACGMLAPAQPEPDDADDWPTWTDEERWTTADGLDSLDFDPSATDPMEGM